MSEQDQYIREIENVIRQMLKPIKNIPFKLVIKSMTGFEVLAFDKDNENDKNLLKKLNKAAGIAAKQVANTSRIKRPRIWSRSLKIP
jgi:hypothetical protein